MTPTRRQDGFTLLELIIAMTIVSFIVLALYSGLHLGITSWDKGTERARQMADTQALQDFIRRSLRQARRIFVNDPDEGRRVTFRGEDDAFTFVAPFLMHQSVGGLYELTLRKDDGALVLEYRPFRPDPDGEDADPESEVLLERVKTFSVQYYGAERMGDSPQWSEEWEGKEMLPNLIRIDVETEEGTWPPLTTALPSL